MRLYETSLEMLEVRWEPQLLLEGINQQFKLFLFIIYVYLRTVQPEIVLELSILYIPLL